LRPVFSAGFFFPRPISDAGAQLRMNNARLAQTRRTRTQHLIMQLEQFKPGAAIRGRDGCKNGWKN